MPQFANAGEKKTHDRKRCAVRLRQSYPFCPFDLYVRPLKSIAIRQQTTRSRTEPIHRSLYRWLQLPCCDEAGPRSPSPPEPAIPKEPEPSRARATRKSIDILLLLLLLFPVFAPLNHLVSPLRLRESAGRDEGGEEGEGNAGGEREGQYMVVRAHEAESRQLSCQTSLAQQAHRIGVVGSTNK